MAALTDLTNIHKYNNAIKGLLQMWNIQIHSTLMWLHSQISPISLSKYDNAMINITSVTNSNNLTRFSHDKLITLQV